MKELFEEYGSPQILASDNGGEFTGEIIVELKKILGIETAHGRPYHPQTQGKVERFNQTLENELTKCLSEVKEKRWIDKVINIYFKIIY